MSIRTLAMDLYQQEKEVGRLQKKLEQAPSGDIQAVQEELEQAVQDRDRLRQMLNAQKRA